MFPDFFGAPTGAKADVQVFTTGTLWQTWTRPRGCSMAYMVAISGGGGGGGGFTGASGTFRGAGGGGGSGGMGKLLIPIFFLPDRLYVQVGLGGNGGIAAGASGTNGSASYVSVGLSTTAAFVVLQSSATGGRFGANGTSGANGTGGGADTAATASRYSQAGISGFNAGLACDTTDLSLGRTYGYPVPGCSGRSGDSSGGELPGREYFAIGAWPQIAGGLGGGGDGSGGTYTPFNLQAVGGTGGGSGTGAGINGGKGGGGFGAGSGGGGGGGGTAGGNGGKGAGGLVYIVSW